MDDKARFERDGDDSGGTRARVLHQVRLLHEAAARREEDVSAVLEFAHGQERRQPLLGVARLFGCHNFAPTDKAFRFNTDEKYQSGIDTAETCFKWLVKRKPNSAHLDFLDRARFRNQIQWPAREFCMGLHGSAR